MKRCAILLIFIVLLGCVHDNALYKLSEEQIREYSSTAVSLSDFSMKIVAYYESQNLSIPKDFDTKQFFALLGKIYPDQSRVNFIQDHYKVSVRPLDGGYSVMLCDPKADRKIMEDLSCHLDRVGIKSWEKSIDTPCVFESNWEQFCK
jgi:UDP-galactopyranose mutase